MHEPGVKPDIKKLWKEMPKKLKNCFIGGYAIVAMIFILGILIMAVGEPPEEMYGQLLAILIGVILLGVALVYADAVTNNIKSMVREMRLKEGLRSTWDDEDHDELEKRVKALEEKLRE